MDVDLQQMDDAGREAYLASARERYSRDLVLSRSAPAHGAARLTDAFFARYSTERVVPPEHHVCHIVAVPSGERLGTIWLHRVQREGWSEVRVVDIQIEVAHGRSDCARAALRKVEERARLWGADRVSGDVFGHKETLLGFILGAGYRVTGLALAKRLTEVPRQDESNLSAHGAPA